mgnify:FL=1
MKVVKQRALALHQRDYSKRIREQKRYELVRLLAELLLQALSAEGTGQGGAQWKR